MSTVLVVHTGELGELLATQFDQYGLVAHLARSGEGALERALHEKPEAVIVDAELPDVGGLELAELLKTELTCPVVLTYPRSLGLGDEGEAFLDRAGRLDGAFAKPFRSLALIGTVADLIGASLEPAPASRSEGDISDTGPIDTEDILVLEDVVEQVLEANPHALDVAVAHLDEEPTEEYDPFGDLEIETEILEGDAAQPEETASHSLADFVSEPGPSDPTALALLWKRLKTDPRPPTTPPEPTTVKAGAGRLTPRALTEVLDAFHQSQSTGEVWIIKDDHRRVLLMAQGLIVGARSNVATEELPRVCVRRGALSPADAKAAYNAVRAGEARDFASAVLERKLISEERLRGLLSERARRVVCGAFTLREGEYRVTHHDYAGREPTRVKVSIGDALCRSIILTEPMDALRRACPDDARFAPDVGGAYSLEELTLTPTEARLVVAMDGTKTIEDLHVLFDGVEERTLRGLASALFRLKLLRLAGRGPAEPRRISFF